MRTLYVYHFETVNNNRIALGQKPLFKIGDTTIEANSPEDAALHRIAQQDSTSNFESLIMDFAVKIPEDFMPNVEHIDKKFHSANFFSSKLNFTLKTTMAEWGERV